jgi:hypothetical protein
MTKTLKEIIQNFTSDEQKEIQAEADKLIADEIKRQYFTFFIDKYTLFGRLK